MDPELILEVLGYHERVFGGANLLGANVNVGAKAGAILGAKPDAKAGAKSSKLPKAAGGQSSLIRLDRFGKAAAAAEWSDVREEAEDEVRPPPCMGHRC